MTENVVEKKYHKHFQQLMLDIISVLEIPEMLRNVEKIVREEIQVEKCTVYVLRVETQELESIHMIENIETTITVPISPASLAGYCAYSGRSYFINDAYGDLSEIDPALNFDTSWDERSGFRTKDVMCAPAIFEGKTYGVIQLMNSKTDSFSEEKMEPVMWLGRMIGYAIYNAQLYEEMRSLKQLKKREAEFMRVLVHELKSPISTAIMQLDLLEYYPEGDPHRKEFPKVIGKHLNKMLLMVEDVLNHSRVKSGMPMGEVEDIDLKLAVEIAGHQIQDQALAKGLKFGINLPDEHRTVRFDRQALSIVFNNLLTNAVKYTDKGHILLRLKYQDNWSIVHVEDSGMGIPTDEIQKIFKEFYRASNAIENEVEGTGVGLAGVKEIVERFGGDLALETEENKGSRFTVRLRHQEASA